MLGKPAFKRYSQGFEILVDQQGAKKEFFYIKS